MCGSGLKKLLNNKAKYEEQFKNELNHFVGIDAKKDDSFLKNYWKEENKLAAGEKKKTSIENIQNILENNFRLFIGAIGLNHLFEDDYVVNITEAYGFIKMTADHIDTKVMSDTNNATYGTKIGEISNILCFLMLSIRKYEYCKSQNTLQQIEARHNKYSKTISYAIGFYCLLWIAAMFASFILIAKGDMNTGNGMAIMGMVTGGGVLMLFAANVVKEMLIP